MKFMYVLLLICIIEPVQLVMNGELANMLNFKYQAALIVRSADYEKPGGKRLHRLAGGAVIIAPRFALTAAHVTLSISVPSHIISRNMTFVRSNCVDRQDPYTCTDHRVVSIKTHQHYRSTGNKYKYDVAVIFVFEPFEGANETIIPFHTHPSQTEEIDYGSKGIVSGWGAVDEMVTLMRYLRYAEIKFVPRELWTECLKEVTSDENLFLCAYTNETDACTGDSGGPLVGKNKRGRTVLI
ncbi:hypothetical protein ILUMI_19950, partial [Ignelater luminosus]